MSISKNPNAYIYTKPVLDAALTQTSITYQLNTPEEAMKWRAHANAYKMLCAQGGPSAYDNLEIKIKGCDVIIQRRVIQGKIFVTGNKEMTIDLAAPEPDDPLLNFAKGLAETLPEVGDD